MWCQSVWQWWGWAQNLLLTLSKSSLLGRTAISFQGSSVHLNGRADLHPHSQPGLRGAWWGDPRSVQGEKVNLYLSFCPLSACLFSPCPFFWTWKIPKKHISKQFSLLQPKSSPKARVPATTSFIVARIPLLFDFACWRLSQLRCYLVSATPPGSSFSPRTAG